MGHTLSDISVKSSGPSAKSVCLSSDPRKSPSPLSPRDNPWEKDGQRQEEKEGFGDLEVGDLTLGGMGETTPKWYIARRILVSPEAGAYLPA